MVTTASAYTDSRYRAGPGEGYDGVVRISVAGFYGTGVLLYDGQAVLTAAHLFQHGSTVASVQFETMAGVQTLASSKLSVITSYDPVNSNNDLAILWLSGSAPLAADRYGLYRSGDEIGQTMTLVGYGAPGSGTGGAVASSTGGALRLKANNQFDADAATLKSQLGAVMSWTPLAGSQLVADFDNGANAQDALGRLIGRNGTGLGVDEGMVASGDSGGPAFINGQIAGIASYSASLSLGGVHPDSDSVSNSSFGEMAFWQRAGNYQQWIDQALRGQYAKAPNRPEEVQKQVPEGNSGTTLAFFLLEFNGERRDPHPHLNVDYATRGGTARAGEDYLAVHGTLVLYPGEQQAVIPVEIIGDARSEPDETFYLDVTDPAGVGFGGGIIKLTAMRTIVNDDGGSWG